MGFLCLYIGVSPVPLSVRVLQNVHGILSNLCGSPDHLGEYATFVYDCKNCQRECIQMYRSIYILYQDACPKQPFILSIHVFFCRGMPWTDTDDWHPSLPLSMSGAIFGEACRRGPRKPRTQRSVSSQTPKLQNHGHADWLVSLCIDYKSWGRGHKPVPLCCVV